MNQFTIVRNVFFITVISILLSSSVFSQNLPEGYDRALKLFEKNDYESSLEVIRTYFKPELKSYEFRMLAASNYLNQNQYEQAMQHLMYCKTEHPDRAEPIALSAVVLRKSGNIYGAARELIQGISRFPEDQQLRIEMARVYFVLGKFPESRAQLDVVLKKDPSHLHAIYLDGLIFIRQGRFEEAEFRLKNVLGMKNLPLNLLPALHNNIGFALERSAFQLTQQKDPAGAQKKFQEAYENYSKAQGFQPENPLYKNNKERAAGNI